MFVRVGGLFVVIVNAFDRSLRLAIDADFVMLNNVNLFNCIGSCCVSSYFKICLLTKFSRFFLC